jgi:CrcB protein
VKSLLIQLLCVGAGGFLGAIGRFVITLGVQRYAKGFPAGTMVVNVVGCLLLGLLLGATQEAKTISPELRSFLAVGLLGSFTTFATFSAEAVQLMRDRQHLPVLIYVVGSVILGLMVFMVGHALGTKHFAHDTVSEESE